MRDLQKLVNAGLVPHDALNQHITPQHAQEMTHNGDNGFVDISTPSPTHRFMAKKNKQMAMDGISSNVPTANTTSTIKSKLISTKSFRKPPPPLPGSLPNSSRGLPSSSRGLPSSSRGSTAFININSTTAHMIGEPTMLNSGRRRRRVNVDAMMRSSIMSQRLSRLSMGYQPSLSGPPGGTAMASADVVSVPILGDCNFDQKYSIAFSQDGNNYAPDSSRGVDAMAKLHALRDVMGSMANGQGYVDRATFSQTFEVANDAYDAYDGGNGMIDGNAILIDAVLELDVGVEEKLQFIFDTIDANKSGRVTMDQVITLISTNFSSAKLEVVGTDFTTVAKLMFRKAGANEVDGMTFMQFRRVFHTYISECYDNVNGETKDKTNLTPKFRSKSKFHTWYEANRLRIWWVFVYVLVNIAAFVGKASTYEVDPALKYGLRIARGCAQVAMLNCVLVLLPMCRSITAVMKRSNLLWKYIPFDDHIEFHKLCGTTLLVAGLIHTGAHISNEIRLYLLATPEEIEATIFRKRGVKEFEYGVPPFTTMLMSLPIVTGILLLLITAISFPLAAIPKFRQGRFNLFWYSHMLFGPFLLIMCIHGAKSWLSKAQSYWWIGPPFLVYLIERRFRYAKMFAAPVRIMEAVELDKTVALFMEKPKRFVYRPGMYLFLNVPAISTHEWHPFTISSAPADNYVSIHVRNAGDWTGALHELIQDCHANKKEYPDVYLDGPVGAPTQDYHRYKTIICVAGGIGVTPFASILKDVVHLWEDYRCKNCSHVRHPSSFKIQKLYFHWTTRAQEALGWFEGTMNQITNMDRDNIIEAHQYLTSVKSSENSSQVKMFQQFVHEQTGHDMVSGMKTKHLTHFGRPDWDQVFEEAKQKHPGEEIGVFFCGPHALDKILAEMCQKYSDDHVGGTYFDYHSEKFA